MGNFFHIRICVLLLCVTAPAFAKRVPVHVMGPLEIGNIRQPSEPRHESEWREFERQLRQIKNAGVPAVSIDVWWGAVAVDPDPSKFDWRYYDRVLGVLEAVGMKWMPILSFHRCGGNHGDRCDVPIPDWLWTKYGGKGGSVDANDLGYRSEYGNQSREVLSVWATDIAIEEYRRFFEAFQTHFGAKASTMVEINVSLGPTGELRYPSYGAHDGAAAGYPTRGALQAYTPLARKSFQSHVRAKYGALEDLNRAWSSNLNDWAQIGPPMDTAAGFFEKNHHLSAYGRDFFAWYQGSLVRHGRTILRTALDVFGATGAAFRAVDLGAKIPGVHWRSGSDRLAELSSGLVSTAEAGSWNDDARGHGYESIVRLFAELGSLSRGSRVVLHFTCLEKPNGEGGASVSSRAEDLVFWIGAEARRQGVPIKGENATGDALGDTAAWGRLRNVLTWSHYEGLTLLRLDEIVGNTTALRELTRLVSDFGS